VKTIGAWYEQKRHGTVMGLISVNFQFGGVAATLFSGLLVAYGLSWVIQLHDLGLITEGMAQWLSAGGPETEGQIMTSVEGTGAGWRLLFICPALVVSLVFVWSFFASKDHPHKVIENVEFPPEELELVNPEAKEEEDAPLGLFASMRDMFKSIFMFWIPKFLTDLDGLIRQPMSPSALFPFLGALGTILLGWYTDKYSKNGDRAKVMWVMLVILSVCLFGIGFLAKSGLDYGNLIVGLIGLCGFFLLGPYSMTSGCLTLDIVGHKRAGACSGLLDGGGYICAAAATYLVGRFADELGWATVFSITAVVALVSAASAFGMSLMFQRKARRELKDKAK
ncbi:MAG: MFS transporter, partial [Planctomycetota bacterium]|nr:MFS transporter [Planctomycetota bacterium]